MFRLKHYTYPCCHIEPVTVTLYYFYPFGGKAFLTYVVYFTFSLYLFVNSNDQRLSSPSF